MFRLMLFLACGISGMGRCAFAEVPLEVLLEVPLESQRYYAFNALVTSLSRAQEAAVRLSEADLSALSEGSVTSVQLGVNDLLNAKERLLRLKQYADTQNKRMKPAVEGLTQAYERLISDCLELILTTHRMAFAVSVNPGAAEEVKERFAASLERLKGGIEKDWDSVFESCVMASYALVEYPFRDNQAFLVFSAPERDDIASEIDALFPEAQRGFQPGQSRILQSACAIRAFLYEVPDRDERHRFKRKKFRYNLRRGQLRASSRVNRQAALSSTR